MKRTSMNMSYDSSAGDKPPDPVAVELNCRRDACATASDQVPDPVAVKAAALEARRMLVISCWPLVLGIGLLAGVLASIDSVVRDDEFFLGVFALLVVCLVCCWPTISHRLQKRLGLFATPYRTADLREPRVRTLLAIMFIVGALLLEASFLVLFLIPVMTPIGTSLFFRWRKCARSLPCEETGSQKEDQQ
ncbi:MAG: hypothetical protein V1899_05215 [Planctomycetota bacterium]